jgi:hypothetical protein
VSFPEPGWNEGINTSAPLIYLAIKGAGRFPTRENRCSTSFRSTWSRAG